MSKTLFGLIGRNISYSFSKNYFTERFSNENLSGFIYVNFDIQNLKEFTTLIKQNPKLKGLNVTIPYKEEIIPYLNKISKKAAQIGAVNVIKITKKGNLKGYNTDYFGFKKALKPFLKDHHKNALILGSGGASKAVIYALKSLNINYTIVSRETKNGLLNYNELNEETFKKHQIIINTTPLGTFPNINEAPNIPYEFLTKDHIAFDLIYNPEETLFLKKAKLNNAVISNGYKMLIYQAEKSFKIWTE